jgi:MoaA/NifB/PqqE/SkfB family radical SAM enzyme
MYYMESKYPLEEIKGLEEYDDEYLSSYNKWFRKEVTLPCLSINSRVVIWANGDFPLCQYKDVVLGNLNHQSFDDIWESEKTRKLQMQFRACNGCWVGFHRGFDLSYKNSVGKIVPSAIRNRLLWK